MFWVYEWTFPVCYKMNSRRVLKDYFEKAGFEEVLFHKLDDLSTFGRFRWLNYFELMIWRFYSRLGMTYPENCLLGDYQRKI